MPTTPENFDIHDVVACLRISRASVYRAINRAAFPRPLKIGRRSIWRAEDVRRWLEYQQLPALSFNRKEVSTP